MQKCIRILLVLNQVLHRVASYKQIKHAYFVYFYLIYLLKGGGGGVIKWGSVIGKTRNYLAIVQPFY